MSLCFHTRPTYENGVRHQPAVWRHVPLNLIGKKKHSDELKEKRDIALPSQMLKLQGSLYRDPYHAIMPRLLPNFGWTPGVAMGGASQLGGYALDQAHLLLHLLIFIYGDVKRFFPSMDKSYILLAEQWYGLPEDVRIGTARLYADACMRYETAHGLADFDFQTLHMKAGSPQGCLLSTEKAKIFLNSLAEALSMLVDGVRFWNGVSGGGRRVDTPFCADDLLGMLTSWAAAQRYVSILDEWAGVSASTFGINPPPRSASASWEKTVISALDFSAHGSAIDAIPPPGAIFVLQGKEIPIAPISATYAHIGDRRSLNGSQTVAVAHVAKLLRGWLACVRTIRKLSRKEFAELTNEGFSSIMGPYAARTPLTVADAERIGEKPRRLAYRLRFKTKPAPANADRYLPASWQAEPQLGLLTSGRPAAQMIGDGWQHLAALNAASLHDEITSSLADGIDSDLRFASRAILDLVCYMWGMRGTTPADWDWAHLEPVLARRRGKNRSLPGDRVCPMEMFIYNFIRMQRAMLPTEVCQVPSSNFTVLHPPSPGDPFDPEALHHQPQTHDTLELFRGPLVDAMACQRAGLQPQVPVWILVSAGVVVRSHACHTDGSRFILYAEAAARFPMLQREPRRARAAWTALLRRLRLMGVQPVRGEDGVSAEDIWYGGRTRGDGSDGTAARCDRAPLDSLLARQAAGGTCMAEEWAAAYTAFGGDRVPRLPQMRPAVLPDVHGKLGPHTRYFMPGKGGTITRRTCGRVCPACTVAHINILRLYALQCWDFSDDGRLLVCKHGTLSHRASVLVRLHVQSLCVVLAEYDTAQPQRVAAHYKTKAYLDAVRDGKDPPARRLSSEERSWEGGPGYNVALARVTLRSLLNEEQTQGYPFTAAAVGDGSWSKQFGVVARSVLTDTGAVLGGSMDVSAYAAGHYSNYDSEAAHRLDFLASVHGSDVFYIFDSTSPVEAGERFRRSSLRTRQRAECDEMQASLLSFEDRQRTLAYWWSHSHGGHLAIAAADVLAKEAAQGAEVSNDHSAWTPVPSVVPIHRSVRFHAKASERAVMLTTTNLTIAETFLEATTAGATLRAGVDTVDTLRACKLCERDSDRLLQMRADMTKLLSSRATLPSGPNSFGGILRTMRCPCGRGEQDQQHVIWRCRLPAVVSARDRVRPALQQLSEALGLLADPTSGTHEVASKAYGCFSDFELPPPALQLSCTAHMLGIIVRPKLQLGLQKVLRMTKPVVVGVLEMQQAAESAVRVLYQDATRAFHRRKVLGAAVGLWRVRRHSCPMPPGRSDDVTRAGNPRLHAVDADAVRAAYRVPADGMSAAHSAAMEIRAQMSSTLCDAQSAADCAEDAAVVAGIIEDSLPAPGDAPDLLAQMTASGTPPRDSVDEDLFFWTRRRRSRETDEAEDSVRHARQRVAATTAMLSWWVGWSAAAARRDATRAAAREAARKRVVVAKAATPALTALQLAAGKQSMKASRAAESAQRDMLAAVRRTGSRVRRSIVFAQQVQAGAGSDGSGRAGGGDASAGGHRNKRRRVAGTVLATAVIGTPGTVRVGAGGAGGSSAGAGIL